MMDRTHLAPELAGPRLQPLPLSPTARSTNRAESLLPPSARRHQADCASAWSDLPARRKWLFAGLTALGIGLAAWCQSGAEETSQPNWKHHNEAAQQADRSIKWLGQAGAAGFLQQVVVSRADVDDAATTRLRMALQCNDIQLANQILQDAQREAVPLGSEPGPGAAVGAKSIVNPQSARLKPQLTAELQQQILLERAKLVQVGLFDSCAEDGDVVEVLLNGVPFCEVPLTRTGAILSVPVAPGSGATLAVRGARDGTGGITVGCWTSQGQGFFRAMQPGEVASLGVVLP